MKAQRQSPMSMTSRSVKRHFAVGIAMVSVIPVLGMAYIASLFFVQGRVDILGDCLVVAAICFFAAVIGFRILLQHASDIASLRMYLDRIVAGQIPDRVTLPAWTDDTYAIERNLNILIDDVRRRDTEVKAEKDEILRQLADHQKIESTALLAARLAHEFNNILMVIAGYNDLILSTSKKGDPLHDDLEQIRLAAQKASLLTRQLLAFGRQQPMDLRPANMNEIVVRMSDGIQAILGADIELVSDLDPDLPLVSADPVHIEQVIVNIVINAEDAMPNGGRVLIKTEAVTLDRQVAVSIPEAVPGRFVRLTIEDSGMGIAKDVMPHIFEPFFTTRKGKGSGLGLSVAHGIIKQHDGWISPYSEPRKGATFKVYLPAIAIARPEKKPGSEPTPEPVPLVRGRGERILLVEDDPIVLTFVSKALIRNGYDVVTARDAGLGMSLFETEKGRFDLLFSDVMLPGNMTGIDLAIQLRKKNPTIPVLLTSGYADPRTLWPIIHQKGFPYLQKPCPIANLLQTIRQILDT